MRNLNTSRLIGIAECGSMVSKIMKILELLVDGQWHEIGELQGKAKLTELQMRELTMFLNQYEFVKIDKETMKVKISKDWHEFLAQTA
jgi:hypothetical protein